MAVNSWRMRNAVTWDTGASSRGAVYGLKKAGTILLGEYTFGP